MIVESLKVCKRQELFPGQPSLGCIIACHSERSEESDVSMTEILRGAQNDRHNLLRQPQSRPGHNCVNRYTYRMVGAHPRGHPGISHPYSCSPFILKTTHLPLLNTLHR